MPLYFTQPTMIWCTIDISNEQIDEIEQEENTIIDLDMDSILDEI